MIDYSKLGFENAKDFAEYYFHEFSQEDQESLLKIGLGGDKKREKRNIPN